MIKDSNKNILLVDIGNTSIKWGEKKNDTFHSINMAGHLYPDSINASYFIVLWSNIEKPAHILASCVADNELWQALVMACDELWNIPVRKIESLAEGFGLVNSYKQATDLGSDRWCAMVAAKQMTDSAFMVVDAGSALTVDIVDESGQHLGGIISPGLSMMKKSLGVNTAQVKVDNKQNSRSLFFGHSTSDCVEAGVFLSVISLIETIYKRESCQVNKLQCILTGGDANLIAGSLSFDCEIERDLVLRGLAVIQKMEQE